MISSAGTLPPLDPEPANFPGQGRIVLAFSGGADSMCLAWQLTRSDSKRSVICLHIDHGLDPDSDQRARQAVELAKTLKLPCRVERVTVAQSGSQEEAARNARYEALFSYLNAGETLLTAHHADDQVETVLLRLLRGSGPHGLAGMETIRQHKERWLVRPMLRWTRDVIQRALTEAGLEWIEDPANQLDHFDRNFLRQTILPQVRSRWPGADRSIVRSARLCQGAAEQIDALINDDLRAGQPEVGRFDLDYLLKHSRYRQGEIVRGWCLACGTTPPPGRRLDSFVEQLQDLSPDRQPELKWLQGCLRAWNRQLWLCQARPPEPYCLGWRTNEILTLPEGLGRLSLEGPASPQLVEELQVSSGAPAERLRLPGREHHCQVTRLMQQSGVPPWERESWPRIYRDETLLAVGDRWMDSSFARQLTDNHQQLQWHRLNCENE